MHLRLRIAATCALALSAMVIPISANTATAQEVPCIPSPSIPPSFGEQCG
jgi:hypothetical protein